MDNNPWKVIYHQQTELYEQLVQHEDYQGHLFASINRLYPVTEVRVVEFGAGTGRVTALLAPAARIILAFDLALPMVRIAHRKLQERFGHKLITGAADNRAVPVASQSADIAIEDWSFAQMMVWYQAAWRREMRQAILEMLRVLRPGGTAMMIETLGTGMETQAARTPAGFLRLRRKRMGL